MHQLCSKFTELRIYLLKRKNPSNAAFQNTSLFGAGRMLTPVIFLLSWCIGVSDGVAFVGRQLYEFDTCFPYSCIQKYLHFISTDYFYSNSMPKLNSQKIPTAKFRRLRLRIFPVSSFDLLCNSSECSIWQHPNGLAGVSARHPSAN